MKRSLLAIAVCMAINPAIADEIELETITITSDFREVPLSELPASATVVDAQSLQDEGGEHFEDALHRIPNLNWSGATSRPRYFQIRGVGEQEEYQGAPNSSVGFFVDDIDLSGIGMAASLFDLQQLEVLRGPQGTRYGANALAGLIYVKSNDPADVFEAGTEVSLGQDDQRTFGGYVSGPVDQQRNLLYRLSVQSHEQNGYRDNDYLGRDDTNERDEVTLRGKLRWYASDDVQIDLTYLHADYDNGYDAWTLDNNGFNTLSDDPGEDSQRTNGAALKLNWQLSDAVVFDTITSWADTDARHAYDGDWANPEYWAARTCTIYDADWNPVGTEPCVYSYIWDKFQERETFTQEVRLSSGDSGRLFNDTTDWLIGLYYRRLEEQNDLESFYNGFPDQFLISDYEATNRAIFGQLDSVLGEWELSVGIRFEHRDSEYSDDAGESFSPSESMWGGHISVSRAITEEHRGYARIARGYKAGGFNMGLPEVLETNDQFDSETLINYELGLRSRLLGGALTSDLALFFMDRTDQQVEASLQDPDNPQRFFLYTNNAGSSENYGLEWSLDYQVNNNWSVYGSVAWLETEYKTYLLPDGSGNTIDLSGRELAHSPNYQFSAGTTYRADSGWFANLNANGADEFFYSDSHDARSDDYIVLNAQLGYEADRWAAYVWGRNLTDERYGVRGFYFGNEPDLDWAPKLYVRQGDPQQFGVTFRYDL